MPYPDDSAEPRRRERRYGPTPYAPRSEATRAYRDAYDLGMRHFGALDRAGVLRYDAGLTPGSPEQRGYRDGVTAAWRREQKARELDPELVRRERAELVEQRRRWGQSERPY